MRMPACGFSRFTLPGQLRCPKTSPPLLGKEGPPKIPANLPYGRLRANGSITSNVLCHIVPVFSRKFINRCPIRKPSNVTSPARRLPDPMKPSVSEERCNYWSRSVHLDLRPPASAQVWFQGINPSRELPEGPQG